MISLVPQPYPVVGLSEWKAQARRGRAPDDVLVRKVAAEGPPAPVEDRTLRFRISSGMVDRDNDTIAPAGWKLGAWMANPVVLWAHDYSALPVAKGTGAFARADGLFADAEFPEEQLYPFGHQVYQLLRGGFLKATSVGLRPLKWTRNEERGGIDFHEQELLEFSIVPVGANPDALVEAKAKGYDLARVRTWLHGSAARLALPKAGAENLYEVDEAALRAAIEAVLREQIQKVILDAVRVETKHQIMMVTGRVD